MTTRCPSLMRATAVSTIRESIDNSGSCVLSCTIELEPVERSQSATILEIAHPLRTQFDHNGKMSVTFHGAYLPLQRPVTSH